MATRLSPARRCSVRFGTPCGTKGLKQHPTTATLIRLHLRCIFAAGLQPLGVTGNTSASGAEESWFDPRRGYFNCHKYLREQGRPSKAPFFVLSKHIVSAKRKEFDECAGGRLHQGSHDREGSIWAGGACRGKVVLYHLADLSLAAVDSPGNIYCVGAPSAGRRPPIRRPLLDWRYPLPRSNNRETQ